MDTGFGTWLIAQMDDRGWNNSDLARRAGLAPSTISTVVNGQKRPGPEFCSGVAVALDVPPVIVFRKAGLLPPIDPETERSRELQYLFRRLGDEDQTIMLTILRAMLGRKRADDKAVAKTDTI